MKGKYMAAGKPKGNVPDSPVRPGSKRVDEFQDEDVKVADDSSVSAGANLEDDVDYDENDLKGIEEEQKVPYKRFKEVNDSAKGYRSEIEKLSARLSDEANEKIRLQAELARRPSQSVSDEDDLTLDDFGSNDQAVLKKLAHLENKYDNLSTKYEKQTLRGSIDRLASEYPDASRISVLGIANSQGVSSEEGLRELFEMQQNAINDAVEKKLRGILDSKKAARQKNVRPVRRSHFSIKEEDRPSTFKEASSFARKLFGE